jgi:hypothetical protein
MSIPHDPAVFPSEERLSGQHIGAFTDDAAYTEQVKTVKEAISESEEAKSTE